ncbi:unnamed protein product [Calypogeia fissa]
MALSACLIVLVLLTTGECILKTVKAQDDESQAANYPVDSGPGENSQGDMSTAETSQAGTSLVDGLPADVYSSSIPLPSGASSPVQRSPAESSSEVLLPADSSPSDSSSDDGLGADTSPSDSLPAPDTSPAISTSNPPALFIFGDSLVDSGNNNYIQTLAKANILFNGIDFPGGPTGRFCNGRMVVDILCDILGIPYPPPFLDPQTNGSRSLRGVNYASGAGGILDSTGADFLARICMNQQISNFHDTTLPQLEAQLGTDMTSTLLASSLVAIIMGSNNYINNYLIVESVQTQYTPTQFNVLLINSFRRQLMELYDFGLRMFFVSGIGPIGCTPHQLAISGQPTCVSSVNAQAQDFNALTVSMLQDLNSQLPDAKYLFGDSYTSLINIINDPGKYGFTVVNEGCCGGGTYRAQVLCQPTASVCSNRKEYVFWDAYHPTEAANLILAKQMYTGGVKAVTPMNVKQLLALQLQQQP